MYILTSDELCKQHSRSYHCYISMEQQKTEFFRFLCSTLSASNCQQFKMTLHWSLLEKSCFELIRQTQKCGGMRLSDDTISPVDLTFGSSYVDFTCMMGFLKLYIYKWYDFHNQCCQGSFMLTSMASVVKKCLSSPAALIALVLTGWGHARRHSREAPSSACHLAECSLIQ